MKNKKSAVKQFTKSSKQLIKIIDSGSFDHNLAAKIKGDLKGLCGTDYQKFSNLVEVHNNSERGSKVKLFLIEKIQSYEIYDFSP